MTTEFKVAKNTITSSNTDSNIQKSIDSIND